MSATWHYPEVPRIGILTSAFGGEVEAKRRPCHECSRHRPRWSIVPLEMMRNRPTSG
jgi:hypothetical protein